MAINNDDQINPEDAVQLNSGGPEITVTGIGSETESGQCGALGSRATTREKAIFPLSSLKHAPQKF
jgi:uncharacterized protein YodC (DUF2158 family)